MVQMEVDDDLSTAMGTETLADRDMVPPWLRQHPGFLGRHPTYRDLRAPAVPEGRAQCRLTLWTKGAQDMEMQPLQ
jgi:hypothetical protein